MVCVISTQQNEIINNTVEIIIAFVYIYIYILVELNVLKNMTVTFHLYTFVFQLQRSATKLLVVYHMFKFSYICLSTFVAINQNKAFR